MEHTTLYRFYDKDDRLLYVGISYNPARRAHDHSKEKPWWLDVRRSTMEHFTTRAEAAAAEVAAIVTEAPLHNVVHNGNKSTKGTVQVAPHRTDRLSSAMSQELTPTTMVGSFFHSAARPGWQGCIVGEPTPGIYLVELFSWLGGNSTNQSLVPLQRMVDEGWQFYDTSEWMRNVYDDGLAERWEREREQDGAERFT